MGRHVTVTLSDGSIISAGYTNSKITGTYSFAPGDKIKVCPVNPNKKKHRDRTGVLMERCSAHGIYINFDDGSYGSVSVCDLVPFSTEELESERK